MATFGSSTLVLKGPKGSTTIEMTGPRVSVGRDNSSDFIVTDTAVSNSHFELIKEDGALVIRDLGSSNGTYVNGKRVQTTRLYDGDVVHIGQSQGGIAVRATNGQPLQPPAEGSAVSVVLWVLALVLFGATGVVGWLITQKKAEHEGFAQFELQAQEVLQNPSPCDLARDSITSLGSGRDLVVPAVAKAGKLEDSELAAHRLLLQKTRKNEQTVRTLLDKLKARAESRERQDQLHKLLEWRGRFNDPSMRDAVEDVQKGLEQQVEDAVKFSNGLEDYAKAMGRFNERLTKAISSEERSPGDLEDPPKPGQVSDLLGECVNRFSTTTADAFKKLASVPL